jgi:hypothetical protein
MCARCHPKSKGCERQEGHGVRQSVLAHAVCTHGQELLGCARSLAHAAQCGCPQVPACGRCAAGALQPAVFRGHHGHDGGCGRGSLCGAARRQLGAAVHHTRRYGQTGPRAAAAGQAPGGGREGGKEAGQQANGKVSTGSTVQEGSGCSECWEITDEKCSTPSTNPKTLGLEARGAVRVGVGECKRPVLLASCFAWHADSIRRGHNAHSSVLPRIACVS